MFIYKVTIITDPMDDDGILPTSNKIQKESKTLRIAH